MLNCGILNKSESDIIPKGGIIYITYRFHVLRTHSCSNRIKMCKNVDTPKYREVQRTNIENLSIFPIASWICRISTTPKSNLVYYNTSKLKCLC